jgi:hypothetical protein
MKDLGTVPVMACSLPQVRAFYPDGAWWTPCLMEHSDRLLNRADALGADPSFCPVRAMLPAFQSEEHFPRPDLLVCSTGAVCDDFSAIAQRLERLGHPILWWEMPRRRAPEPGEDAVRVFWVNPVADLRAMNLLEACGGRLCGSDFMLAHALDLIPEDLPPFDALSSALRTRLQALMEIARARRQP